MIDKPPPPQPPELAFWFYDHAPVQGARVESEQTGTDTSENFITFFGRAKSARKIPVREIPTWVSIAPGWNAIAALTEHMNRQVIAHRAFVKANARDIAEFERLKKKLGK